MRLRLHKLQAEKEKARKTRAKNSEGWDNIDGVLHYQGRYDSIFIIVDRLTKMVYYKPVKVTINAPSLAELIIDMVVRHHGLLDLILTDQRSLFTLKFLSSLCYFLGIKRRLPTAFYPQMDCQTERQNRTMEAYLRAFVNFEQNDWAKLLPMAEFAYNNAKNASTGFTPFKLNCGYHP